MLTMILFAAGELAIASCFAISSCGLDRNLGREPWLSYFFLLGALAVTIGEPITYRLISLGNSLKDDPPAYFTTLAGHGASLVALLLFAYGAKRRQD